MKIHNISIAGGLIGTTTVLLSLVRYFIIFNDPSQGIIGASIGGIIILGAYLYNWMKYQEEQYDKVNKRLDAFTDWWTKQEITE